MGYFYVWKLHVCNFYYGIIVLPTWVVDKSSLRWYSYRFWIYVFRCVVVHAAGKIE